MASPLYLDASAFLRATIEAGTTPDLEERIGQSQTLLTSRLALVESARAMLRIRRRDEAPAARIADAERHLEKLLARCEILELTEEVCELASRVAPTRELRTLDALHLATFLLARKRVENLGLLTADPRLAEAAETT